MLTIPCTQQLMQPGSTMARKLAMNNDQQTVSISLSNQHILQLLLLLR